MIYLNVEEVKQRTKSLARLLHPQLRNTQELGIYGVPRGGIPVAYVLSKYISGSSVVASVSDASIIVDDIVDSGKTRTRYGSEYPDKDFVAIVDKQKERINDWVVFPWEQTEEKSIEDSVIRLIQYSEGNVDFVDFKKFSMRVNMDFGIVQIEMGKVDE